MAITKDDLLEIMGRNTAFKLYGIPSTEELTDILVQALCRYCQIDPPRISATMSSAVDYTTAVLPASLANAQRIVLPDGTDALGWTEYRGVITFGTLMSAGDVTVYGFPATVRSDVDSIIAAIPEARENILLTYCRAYYFDAMGAGDADPWLAKGDGMLKEASLSANRSGLEVGTTYRAMDSYGRAVDPGPFDTDDFTDNVYTDTEMDY